MTPYLFLFLIKRRWSTSCHLILKALHSSWTTHARLILLSWRSAGGNDGNFSGARQREYNLPVKCHIISFSLGCWLFNVIESAVCGISERNFKRWNATVKSCDWNQSGSNVSSQDRANASRDKAGANDLTAWTSTVCSCFRAKYTPNQLVALSLF